jgi:hypothetical protein
MAQKARSDQVFLRRGDPVDAAHVRSRDCEDQPGGGPAATRHRQVIDALIDIDALGLDALMTAAPIEALSRASCCCDTTAE